MEMEMENGMEGGQWCNICCNMVNPMISELGDENKCPTCGTEFTEVMGSIRSDGNYNNYNDGGIDLRSSSVFSLYAPILLGLMSATFSPSLAAIASTRDQDQDQDQDQELEHHHHELVLRRRRRTSTSLMLIFRRLHDRMVSDHQSHNLNVNPENNSNTTTTAATNYNSNNNNNSNNSNLNLNVIVIDPFNEEALILRGPSHSHSHSHSPSHLNHARVTPTSESPVGSLGEFLDGPGFGLLLQQLAQNDPNRYITNVNPPAQKAAIEAMASVRIEEKMQCIICLEDSEIGSEVKEMPCKHKFHSACIVSWLELHSSCPVCRFQMPHDDSKIETNLEHRNEGNQNTREERIMRYGRRNWLSILQPFDNFLPSP